MVDLIRALCKEQRMSLNDLEEQTGLGINTIYKWDNASPATEKVQRVADFFGVSVDSLLGREPSGDVDEVREILHKDKRYGVLLSASKKLTTKDLDALIHIVESMGDGNE